MLSIHIDVPFDAEATLFCGQNFRFKKTDNGYVGVAADKPLFINTDRAYPVLCMDDGDQAFWHTFFDLSRDYAATFQMCKSEAARKAYAAFPGLRVLRQPYWDTVVSFIVSANNNIKRITGILDRLSAALGEEIPFGGHMLYALPTPSAIIEAGEARLKELGLGYRANYLFETALTIKGGFDLSSINGMDYEAARRCLMSLKGVGDKVCDCILLFAYGFAQAVPVDVWMERVLLAEGFSGNRVQLKRAAMEAYGENAGIIQQALFHAARNGIISV